MKKTTLLICLLLPVFAQAQKPQFKDCDSPDCQEQKWSAFYTSVHKEIANRYPYQWEDSLAIRFTLNQDGAVQVLEKFSFAAPKALTLFKRQLDKVSEQLILSKDTFLLHLPLLLPSKYAQFPSLNSRHDFPILPNCSDYNDAGRLACYHYLLDLVRDTEEEQQHEDPQETCDFSLAVYFENGSPKAMRLEEATLRPGKAERFMRSFIATYQELFSEEQLAGSDDFQISMTYQNLPFGKEKMNIRQAHYQEKADFIWKIKQDTAAWLQEVRKYARAVSGRDSLRLNNELFIKFIEDKGWGNLKSLPFNKNGRRIDLDSVQALASGKELAVRSKNDEAVEFTEVERVPVFSGCDDLKDNDELKSCFQKGILTHVAHTFKFPEAARQKGIQGRMYISFVVEKDGSVGNISVLRGAHPLLDLEGVRVVSELPKIEPAILRGKPVRMRFTLPINARLE